MTVGCFKMCCGFKGSPERQERFERECVTALSSADLQGCFGRTFDFNDHHVILRSNRFLAIKVEMGELDVGVVDHDQRHAVGQGRLEFYFAIGVCFVQEIGRPNFLIDLRGRFPSHLLGTQDSSTAFEEEVGRAEGQLCLWKRGLNPRTLASSRDASHDHHQWANSGYFRWKLV